LAPAIHPRQTFRDSLSAIVTLPAVMLAAALFSRFVDEPAIRMGNWLAASFLAKEKGRPS
ncbi:MAG: hypothetical protein ACJ8DO_04375, partial [Microvirga sp.]